MKALFLVIVSVALLVRYSAPPAASPLSPDDAKAALLAMMRSTAGREVEWFKDGRAADALAARTIERDEHGYTWGPFWFDLPTHHYGLLVEPQPVSAGCTFECQGKFIQRNQKWLATTPEVVTIMTPAH